MQEVKKALRKELIAKRRVMATEEKGKADGRIFQKLLPLLKKASSVLTYVSTEIEVGTVSILEYCFENGIPVAVPVSGDSELSFFEIRSFSELSEGRFGILEPTAREREFIPDEKTLCIVPALCADGEGLRLGYGRGYYDRYLDGFAGISVILCYNSFKMEVPSEAHDRRADITIFDD